MHRPKEIVERLAVSPATLRLWSNTFAEFLSPAAQASQTETGGAAQRRYGDEDLAVFLRVKALLGQGKTYEDIKGLLPNPAEGIALNPATEAPSASSLTNGHWPADGALAIPDPVRLALVALQDAVGAKQETIDTLKQTVAVQEQYLATLREDVESIKRQQEATAVVQKLTRWDHFKRAVVGEV